MTKSVALILVSRLMLNLDKEVFLHDLGSHSLWSGVNNKTFFGTYNVHVVPLGNLLKEMAGAGYVSSVSYTISLITISNRIQ